jgi:DNA polymerase-3 subunit epsilon
MWPFTRPHRPALDAARSARRDALRKQTVDLKRPLDEMRWVVVDLETGGPDAARDPLLAIGAVAIEADRIVFAPSLEVGLRQTRPADAHATEPHSGQAPHAALLDWLEFAQGAPCVAFHAAFDQAVLQRALRTQLDLPLKAPWFDAGAVASRLFPDAARHCRQLHEWLAHFGIAVQPQRGALANACATAELWLVLLAAARRENIATAHQLQKLARARRRPSDHR